jgi:hypothetical protein
MRFNLLFVAIWRLGYSFKALAFVALSRFYLKALQQPSNHFPSYDIVI